MFVSLFQKKWLWFSGFAGQFQGGKESPKNKFQIYRPINATGQTILSLGFHGNGKRATDRRKIRNFQKLAWYSPKNGNEWTKCLPHHFGGVFCEVFGVRSKIWAPKVPFFGTWKRALLAKKSNIYFLAQATMYAWSLRQLPKDRVSDTLASWPARKPADFRTAFRYTPLEKCIQNFTV